MKLALPLGMLGLTAIAALILIYILKPKYQDKKVSSTYVWRLSLRYAKKKVPLQWLKSSLLLIVQLLIMIALAFMMSQPYIVLASKNGEKIAVLSASASMMTEEDGKTRFDRAKEEISDLAEKTLEDGDRFSVILAGDEASFVVRRSDSLSYIKQKLFEAKCSFSQSDTESAMELAENVMSENPEAEVYLFTDAKYEKTGKVRVEDMSRGEWNAAVLDFSVKREKGRFVFSAQIASYGRAAEMAVNLSVNGKTQLPKLAQCGENESKQIVWDTLEIADYENAELHLNADDAFPYDNDFYIYKPNTDSFRVQLESENPGFLFSVLHSTGKCQVDLVSEQSPAVSSGYDLYVYDGVFPDKIPTDGAIWLIDPPKDLPKEWGMTFGNKNSGEFTFGKTSASATNAAILKNVDVSEMRATEYSPVLTYAGYESIMTCNGEPVLLVGDTPGVKTAVLALDIHMTDLPVQLVNFPILIGNLCDYSMTHTLKETRFNVGDTVDLGARANTETMSVKANYSAGGESEETFTEFPASVRATRAGSYTVTQKLSDGRTVTDGFFVRIPARESVFDKTLGTLVNPVVMNVAGTDTDVQNDTMDIFVYLAAALFVLVCVEWGLQYREQY